MLESWAAREREWRLAFCLPYLFPRLVEYHLLSISFSYRRSSLSMATLDGSSTRLGSPFSSFSSHSPSLDCSAECNSLRRGQQGFWVSSGRSGSSESPWNTSYAYLYTREGFRRRTMPVITPVLTLWSYFRICGDSGGARETSRSGGILRITVISSNCLQGIESSGNRSPMLPAVRAVVSIDPVKGFRNSILQQDQGESEHRAKNWSQVPLRD